MTSAAATVTGLRATRLESPDILLVERCKQGDVDAFCGLVDRYKQRVYSFVAHSVRNRDDAEDLTQDVFVQAFAAIRRYRVDASFRTWIFRIAQNRVIDHCRRQRKRGQVVTASLDDGGEESPNGDRVSGPEDGNPLVGVCRDETAEIVRAAVASLSDKLRTVVVLYDFEGCSYEEIARVVGCPIGTVKSRLFNARAELKRKLEPRLAEPVSLGRP